MIHIALKVSGGGPKPVELAGRDQNRPVHLGAVLFCILTGSFN